MFAKQSGGGSLGDTTAGNSLETRRNREEGWLHGEPISLETGPTFLTSSPLNRSSPNNSLTNNSKLLSSFEVSRGSPGTRLCFREMDSRRDSHEGGGGLVFAELCDDERDLSRSQRRGGRALLFDLER